MTGIDIFKNVVDAGIGIGAGAIISGIVDYNTEESKGFRKICIALTKFVATALIVDKLKDHAEKMIDETVNDIHDAVDEIKRVMEENKKEEVTV